MSITNLPIVQSLCPIQKMVECHDVTIVATPTGSGKTLLVPAWLQDRFNCNVYVTVPRVLLAKSSRDGVARLVIGRDNLVGLRTGKGDKYPYTKLQYITEGSYALRVDGELGAGDILIIDEVHEQGINTEEVLYLAVKHIEKGGKVVLMSATIDLDKYIKYYQALGLSVGVYEMAEPKRPFNTSVVISEDCIGRIIVEGGRWLVGVDGKDNLEKMGIELKKKGWMAKIFPLHGEIEEWEEDEALSHKGDCIFIATSVAMSGITFPELDGVWVPHYGKRIQDYDLLQYALSKAEQKQWEGRVGRTQDGIALYEKWVAEYEGREENVTPEILRTPVRNVVLSFAAKGYDLENVKLLNQPEFEKVVAAKAELCELELLDENGIITGKGLFVQNSGLGVDGGLFAYWGREMGIEGTARKIASLIEKGTPYRKGNTGFGRQILKDCKISQISDHYRTIRMIEEDYEQHFGSGAIFELVKKYGEDNSIFLKGVNKLLKEFGWIEKNFPDEQEVTVELIQALFAVQPKKYKFEYGWNNVFGNIVPGYGVFAEYLQKCYATPSPICVKRGRIIEMATKI